MSDTGDRTGQVDKNPAGECPEHGVVSGEDVKYQFPQPSTCARCGEELPKTVMVRQKRLQEATA